MNEKKDSPFWSLIGKAGVLVALVWGGLQIYSYLFKTKDFEAIATGRHSGYSTSPVHVNAYQKSAEYKAFVKAIIERDGALKDYHLDSLLNNFKRSTNVRDRLDYEMFHDNLNVGYNNDYKSLWTFQVKNNGNNPLQELALELPFKGFCRIILPTGVVKDTFFLNKIDVGELRPSYEITVVCWSDFENYGYGMEDAESKSRFTHKNGWFSISYPIEVTGIYAWNKRNMDMPLVILCVIIVFAFMILFASGHSIGYKKAKTENNTESDKDAKSDQSEP